MNYEGFETLIAAIGTGDKNTALEIRNLFTHLIKSIFLPGDIKIVYCTPEEIAADFDATGLGLNKRIGWRICNALHGTPPMAGRVPVGYGDGFTEIGDTGGSKDAVLVNHHHDVDATSGTDGGTGTQRFTTGRSNENGGRFGISTAGESGVGKNMQPYTILLYLMKTDEE